MTLNTDLTKENDQHFQNKEALSIREKVKEDEKCKLIQHQLILLIHAYKNHSGNDCKDCSIPYCELMCDILNHIPECRESKICSVKHCISSKRIISHWNNCSKDNCNVCSSLKSKELNTYININSFRNLDPQEVDKSVLSDRNISTNIRSLSIEKIVQYLYDEMVDVSETIDYAFKIEYDMYTKAYDIGHYNFLLNSFIFKIKKEIEENKTKFRQDRL